MRGQVQTDLVATSDPAIGVYLDGVYLGRGNGSALTTLDLERIEVLRGPQGTLFGRNTTGGALNIVSKDPSDQIEGFVSARIGNYDSFEMRSEEHTSELQSLMRISYAVFCLKKKKNITINTIN